MKFKNMSWIFYCFKFVGVVFVFVFVVLISVMFVFVQNGDVEIEVMDVNGKKLFDVNVIVIKEGMDVNIKVVLNKCGKVKLMIFNLQGEYSFIFEGVGFVMYIVLYLIELGKVLIFIKFVDQVIKNKVDVIDFFNEVVGLIQGGKEEEVFVFFIKVCDFDFELVELYCLIVIIQVGCGNIDEVEEVLNIFFGMNFEGFMQVVLVVYDVFCVCGDVCFDEVCGMFQQIGIVLDYVIKVFNEGVVVIKVDDKVKVMEFFQEVFKFNLNFKNVYQLMVVFEFNDEKYEVVILYLQKFVEFDLQYVEGYKFFFFSYMNIGKEVEVVKIVLVWGVFGFKVVDEIFEQVKIKFKVDDMVGVKIFFDMIFGMSFDYFDGMFIMGMFYVCIGKVVEVKKILGCFFEFVLNYLEVEVVCQMIVGF